MTVHFTVGLYWEFYFNCVVKNNIPYLMNSLFLETVFLTNNLNLGVSGSPIFQRSWFWQKHLSGVN